MTDRVGQQLGNYQLLKLIGRGSFAEVYLGEHQILNTQAAIKVLNTHFTSEDETRFYAEARNMARLSHHHIVRVLDFNVNDGFPFLIMEYAPNGTLRQRHPKGTKVPLEIVVSYIRQVAKALQYIHSQKLIHRDVKPESMLLGQNHEILLTEFGTAVVAQSTRSAQIRQPQEVAESVIYMAPEQLMGKPRPASDQYALAIVTYEWLSGDPPFKGSVPQLTGQHLSTPPPSLHQQILSIPPAIEQVVFKALAKDPQQRFASVQDFSDALEESSKVVSTAQTTFFPSAEQQFEGGQSPPGKRNLPSGTVTLLFTDIEGSTRLLQRLGDSYAEVLAECRQLMRATFQEWNGREVDTQGDAFFIAFARATDAVLAAVDAQRALSAHPWPEDVVVRVRMGLHTGEPTVTQEGYVGMDVHRAARIMSAGHGGQVLLSQATANLVEQDLPEEVTLRDLGEHHLKDLARPRHLYQLAISGVPDDFPPLKTLDTYPNNLPIQLTPFIGREQELETILQMLRRDDVRLLTLTGPGGAGKTRLGLQAAAELTDFFKDGVFFVNLAPISDSALVVPTIAETLDIQERADPFLQKRLKEILRKKQMLLLLDNFEQVIDAGVQVGDLLTSCPGLNVLVTSREALHLQAEHELPVPPLELPDPKHLPDLAEISQNAAIALFLQRGQAVKPDFQLTNANARAIVEICVRLDGLPLAIELAAARMKLFPPQALLARLNQRLAVLSGPLRDLPVRQQTLRNTIAWSYNLLNAQEQRLFRWLSVFVDGCTLQAIESVCSALSNGDEAAQVLDAVASLIDKSLLQQTELEGEEPRFMMLETIREYGLERLAANEEMEATRQAHAEYFLTLAEEAEPQLMSREQAIWLKQLEREYDNLRAAFWWLVERGESGAAREMALRLSYVMAVFSSIRGFWSEARTILERAIAGSESVEVSILLNALDIAGGVAFALGDLDRAEALAKESLTLHRELENVSGIAQSLERLGTVARTRGDLALSRSLIKEASELWRKIGDENGIASTLVELAGLENLLGQYAKARTLFEESLAMRKALGNKRNISQSLFRLAEALFLAQIDPAAVHSLLEESLMLCRELGDKDGIAYCLRLSGQVAYSQEDTALARVLAEESLALFRELGNRWGTAESLSLLAKVATLQHDFASAHSLNEESLSMAMEGGDKLNTPSYLEGLAAMATAQEHLIWATRLWGAAEVLRQVMGTPIFPVDLPAYESNVAEARSKLGEKAFAATWAEGRVMTPQQALDAQSSAVTTQPASTMQSSTSPAKPTAAYPDGLTAREVEVLRLLAQGMTDAQIAEQLVISPRTVNNHLTSIYQKIQVSSRSAATRYAVDHGLD
jgi:predicted ATPase/class 3 adenylate cyclase/DNA-binding CsgD family transcriptional regulator